ncbi:MAG: SsrA-binding protein [Chloroflexi bacterium RBG_16_48_8]|nr:MAG: SsrA-binding protein [Chloroflexi bacterium RBG_16_48_8]
MKNDEIKIIATNRKVRHDYFIEDRLEAGIVLWGTEIKSVRAGRVSLREAFVSTDGDEAWLVNAHIAPYDPASRMNHEPKRKRKLLLHKKEIIKLFDGVMQKGYTIVPITMYLKSGKVKVEIALARGKKQYDKRRDIAKRDAEREMSRSLGGWKRR